MPAEAQVFDLEAEADQDDASGYVPPPATEEEVLDWYRLHRPKRYLHVKRAFDAYHRIMRNGNGGHNGGRR